jgi:PKD domain
MLAVALVSPHGTNVCDIDGKPTAVADGARAVLSHVTFTLKAARTWALFSFPGRYHARTPIRFPEERGQLQYALPPDSLRHTVRWDFGDGTHAMGWAVTHRDAHAGIYRITVNAYYSTWHRYFPFDNVRIRIAR